MAGVMKTAAQVDEENIVQDKEVISQLTTENQVSHKKFIFSNEV